MSSRIETTRHDAPVAATSGGDDLRQRLGQGGDPIWIVGAVEQRQRVLIDDLQPPGDAHVGGRGFDRMLVELAQEGLGGRAREREVAALEGAERADGRVRIGLRLHDPGAALGGHLLGDREAHQGAFRRRARAWRPAARRPASHGRSP